jgi:aminoglycoside 3-N-acetyltransferase
LARSDDGYVVFMGVGLQCNTTFHHVEEVAALAYHMQPDPVLATVVDYEGQERTVRVWLHRYGPKRNFPRPEPYFLAKGIEKMGRIGNCVVRVLRARPMVEYTLERVRQDPEYLLAPPAER